MTVADPRSDDAPEPASGPPPGNDWRLDADPAPVGSAPLDGAEPSWLDPVVQTVDPYPALDAEIGDPDGAPVRGGPKRPVKHRRPTSRVVAEYGLLALFAIVLAFVIRTFVGLAFYIPSESMVPTLKVHDRVIVSRVSYRLHDPHRGDVVVFDNPNFDEPKRSLPKRLLRDVLEVVGINQPKDKNLIKRVIGLPGETVQGREGHVFINGKQLTESYLPEGVSTGDFAPVTVPADHLWVMGDNRANSADSRFMAQSPCATTSCPKGTIARSSIVGRAFVRIWPPWRIALL